MLLNSNNRPVIFGVGTGRCGTKSLATLLNLQTSTKISHELGKPLPWNYCEKSLFDKIGEINSNNKMGDVAFYYLNYIPKLIDTFSGNIRIIGLKRDMNSTVKSYLNHTRGRNHWRKHNGILWKKDKVWDKAYPKYTVWNKTRAISKYYKDYYTELDRLVEIYPQNICIFDTRELNLTDGIHKILEFAGVNNSFKKIIVHENKSNIQRD